MLIFKLQFMDSIDCDSLQIEIICVPNFFGNSKILSPRILHFTFSWISVDDLPQIFPSIIQIP